MNKITLCALLVAACHKHEPEDLHWKPQRATELVVGPHHIPIPTGWRDVAEGDDRDIPPVPPGTVMMTPESIGKNALRTNILFVYTATPPGSDAVTCELLATTIGAQQHGTVSDVLTEHVAGQRVCRFVVQSSEARQAGVIRFEGDHELIATWTRMANEGNDNLGAETAIWNGVLTGLDLPTSPAAAAR